MKHIAFDLGGSGGKVAVGDIAPDDRLRIELVHSFENRQMQVGHSLFWNVLGIYGHLQEGIHCARQAYPETCSVGVDSFCNDFGIVDGEGTLISQVHCYRDGRTARHEANIYRRISKADLYRKTGNQNALFNTAMQLGALAEEGKQCFYQAGNTLLLLPDLLGFFLTGVRRTEFSNASVTQLFDFATGDWQPEILRALETPHTLFAPLTLPGTVVGAFSPEAAGQLGVKGMKVVAVCSHDTASAVAALPTNREDVAFLSSGTWSLLGTEVPAPIITDESFRLNFANEGGAERRIRLLRNVMGLWLVQELRHSFRRAGNAYTHAELTTMAEQAPPFRSLVDVDASPFFAPGGMPEKIARACRETGQPAPETPGQFVRCVLESLAMKYRWTLDHIERVAGKKLSEIYLFGGGGQNGLLNQCTANATRRPVNVGLPEATLCGNLLMQLLAYGKIKDLHQGRELLARSFPMETYVTQQEDTWEGEYQRFTELFALQG